MAGMELTDPDTGSTSTGDVTGTRFYTFGGATVAVRTAQGLSLLLGDEQGSAQIMMPLHTYSNGALLPATQADADATQRTAYAPYGARRGGDLEDINRGWLGQVEDTGTGLTYLNARYYDPAIGRFLSPDPLMNPGDPRTLDPYRYADNNPVVYTDATGLWACPAGPYKAACEAANNINYNTKPVNQTPTPGGQPSGGDKSGGKLPKYGNSSSGNGGGGVPSEIGGVLVKDLLTPTQIEILNRYPGRDANVVGYVLATNKLRALAYASSDPNSGKTIHNEYNVAMWDWVERVNIDSQLKGELGLDFAYDNHSDYGGAVSEGQVEPSSSRSITRWTPLNSSPTPIWPHAVRADQSQEA